MRLGKTTIIHFSSQVIISVAGFVATLVIARFLGAEGLGKYAVAVALGSFWLLLPANALGTAITKRVSEGSDKQAYLSIGFVLNFLVAVAIAVLVLSFREQIDAYVGAPVGELVAVLAVAGIALDTVLSGLKGQKKVAEVGILRALERIGRTSAQVAILLLGYGVAGLIFGHFSALIVVAVFGLVLYDIGLKRPTLEHLQSILTYAKYSWLTTLKSRVFGWMDTIVLAFFVAPSLIGIYEAAWGLASLLAMISSSIRQTLFPEMSELSADDEYDRIKHYLNEGLVYGGVFVIPGFFGAAVVGDRVLRIYRPEFEQGAGVLLILITAYATDVYGSQFVNVLNAIDRPDIAFRVNLAFVVTNVILNVGLIFLLGWYGAAIATAVSTALMLVLAFYSLVRIVGLVRVPFGEILREMVAGFLMAVGVIYIDPIVPSGHYGTIGLVLLGALIYTGVLLILSKRIRWKVISLVRSINDPELQ